MNKLKVLELVTVCAGLTFVVLKAWSVSSKSQHFPGVTAVNLMLTLLFEAKFSLRDIKLYRSGDAGLWCGLILPAIVRITSPADWELFHFLAPCTLVVYLRRVERSVSVVAATAGLVACITAEWTFLINEHGGEYTGLLIYSAVYCLLLWYTPHLYPSSFTFGEVSMVTQLLTYFLYTSLGYNFNYKMEDTAKPLDKLTGIAFIGVLLAVLLINKSAKSPHPVSGIIATIVIVGGAFCLPAVLYVVGWQDLQTIIVKLFWTQTSMVLLSWWAACTSLSILLVMRYGSRLSKSDGYGDSQEEKAGFLYDKPDKSSLDESDRQKLYKSEHVENVPKAKFKSQIDSSTATSCTNETHIKQLEDDKKDIASQHKARSQLHMGDPVCRRTGTQQCVRRVPVFVRKYFHVAMLCVYVPGLLYHPDLLYLASAVAAGVVIVIEAIRIGDVPVFSETLNQYLKVFLDHQDQGDLILTPVYLLIGCSLPLWLEHRKSGYSPLSLYAGLISIGVGDSVASLIGRRYGRHKWPDSQKSIEGTGAAVISQILTVVALSQFGVPDSGLSVALVTVLCLSACLEAFSTQIDNLVVPVFTYMLLAANSLQT